MTGLTIFIQDVVGGLGIGSVYALIALGFSLIYRAIGLVNFAQGNLVMFGTYIGLTFSMGLLGVPALSPLLAFLIGLAAGALIGVGLERLFRPLAKLDLSYMLVGTIGIGIVLDNVASRLWGSQGVQSPTPIPNTVIRIGGVSLVPYYFLMMAVAAVLVTGLQFFLTRTNLGRALRASAQDREVAACFGIPVNRMNALAFAIGVALAAAAGMLSAPVLYTYPAVGNSLGIKGFVAAVIGGLGDIPGAILGGLMIGVAETIIAGYISSAYTDLFAYLLLTLVLIVRPEGLLGARTVEKV
ncbi:MAG TPA: branched-chain amino acid ABC transporter permease [Ktedonobacteraceae bacterium]|nr:branched-chain amino acid ABC transporter permease [Ktedonobacteraceae bacterium]